MHQRFVYDNKNQTRKEGFSYQTICTAAAVVRKRNTKIWFERVVKD